MSASPYVPVGFRRLTAERAHEICEYCRAQQRYASAQFQIDHILPYSAGGETVLENLCFACPDCNGTKRSLVTAVDPVSGRRVRLYHPRVQRWSRHFEWSEDFCFVVGKTAVGRATIAALNLNRSRIVAVRELLAKMGLHPPRTSP